MNQKEQKRPSWDEFFMQIARESAKMSTCLRRQVGAVAVINKRIIATGFNGAPPGMKHCSEIGCIRQKENIPSGTQQEICRAIHAEENLIIQAAITGVSIEGATIYCTLSPCSICARKLIVFYVC